jgi:hypothetical protein
MKAIYRVEFYFHADPDRPDLDIGRELSNALHQAVGGDAALHNIASECGVKACGRSWERTQVPEPSGLASRLFVGCFPAGISYADRSIEEHGDYKRVAFLPYRSLELEVSDPGSPLLPLVCEEAAKIQARRGEVFGISACGRADAAAGITSGQTVLLGG